MNDDILIPSPAEIAGMLRRRWSVALALALVVAGTAAVYIGVDADASATAELRLLEHGPVFDESLSRTDEEMVQLQSTTFREKVEDALGRDLDVKVIRESSIYKVTVTGPEATVVEDANTYAATYVEARREELVRELTDQADRLEASLAGIDTTTNSRAAADLQTRIVDLRERAEIVDRTITVWRAADKVNTGGSAARIGLILALGIIAGVAGGLGYDAVRGQIFDRRDARRLVPNLPVLAVHRRSASPEGEVRNALLAIAARAKQDDERAVFVVSGVSSADDAHSYALRLAAAGAGSNKRALVIDGGAPRGGAGSEPASSTSAQADVVTTPGTDLALDVFATERDWRGRIDHVAAGYELVVIAAPPSCFDDIAPLAVRAPVVLVGTVGKSTAREVREAMDRILSVGGTPLGLVLDGA